MKTCVDCDIKNRSASPACRLLIAELCLLVPLLCARGDSPVDWVNPMIGTANGGNVYPGATLPFGFVQISPDTTTDVGSGCSGYRYSDPYVLGFSLNHLSGTGCPELGNILFAPTVGEVKMIPGSALGEGYLSRFSHSQEEARPGYYSVWLPDYQVKVELTATARVGMQRYTFPKTAQAHIILDLWHGVGNHPTHAMLAVENDHTVSGFRNEIDDVCNYLTREKEYYFVAEFSKSFATNGISLDGKAVGGKQACGEDIKAHFDFQTKEGEALVVRVGLSTVSVEGARRNLRAEANTWDFDTVAEAARKEWDETLGKVRIEASDANLKKTFYTALYHTQLMPIVFNDEDGQFRGPDNQVHQANGFNYYTDFSLWDTFRAEQPLLALLQPQRVNDIIRTMLMHYRLLGEQMLPVETFGGRETFVMIGDPSVPVIAAAYADGLREWDANEALSATVGASGRTDEQPPYSDPKHNPYAGFSYYQRQGWIPSTFETRSLPPPGRQSVSKVLEFAYDDACASRLARSLGRNDLAETYAQRSTNWHNVFDPATGFMRGRNADGSWISPFDPARVDFADYTEANAWQYTFFVPHDVPGLIQAMGGDEKFVAKLDELFDTKAAIPNLIPDLTGLIGMYCQGNEPCHNFAYLYNYAGQPWKTQGRIRQVACLYDGTPGGICGNDDCGQMSAWYVFTALGLYPVDPASGVYVIGSPLVDKAVIQLDRKYYQGQGFTIVAKNNSAQNPYVQAAYLNGEPLSRSWITHREIAAGGTLELVMGPAPNKSWGAAQADRPAQALTP